MDPALPLVAFLASLLATRWSLGLGFVAVFTVGYLNGIIRANFLGVFSTFMFDAGLLGLYAGFFIGMPRRAAGVWGGTGGGFAVFLIGWPILMCAIPVNDLLIQLVALRATIWFLPAMVMARRLTAADLSVIARALGGLNLVTLAVGVYLYLNGIQALYPRNAVTQIMYLSGDVAGGNHRIPSTFLSAHSYGGAMLFSLPFLLDRLFGPGARRPDRVLAACGTVAAAGGLLLCAAKQPIATFGLAAVIAWGCTRFNLTTGVVIVGLVVAAGGVASTDQRLQRAAALENTAAVSGRLRGSANESFLELLVQYPLGAGMGSSVGTSIPYFLAGRTSEAIGMENEYCRILIDQGWVGLAAWVVFLVWLYHRPPPARLHINWGLGVILMYALTLTNWATAFLGTGTLASVPGSVLLLTQMGVLIRAREIAETRPTPPLGGGRS
ncbi:MAG: hypothetical protein JWO38_5361 [Gemmataceae bacterium]|nr:hypothetical protein [Gemmataceae bacterium]